MCSSGSTKVFLVLMGTERQGVEGEETALGEGEGEGEGDEGEPVSSLSKTRLLRDEGEKKPLSIERSGHGASSP